MICVDCGRETWRDDLQQCLTCRRAVKTVTGASEAFRAVCRRCGEPLVSLESRQRGYGPTCWVYVKHERLFGDGSR